MSYRRVLLAAGPGADIAPAQAVLRALAPLAEIAVVHDPNAEALGSIAAESGAELVVAAALPPGLIPALADIRKRHNLAVLWLDARAMPPRPADRLRLFCVALGARAEASLGAFLRDRGGPRFDASVFTLARPAPRELSAALSMAGVAASVNLVAGPPWRALEHLQRDGAVDLIVLTHFPRLLPRKWQQAAPILVLPPLPRREAEIQRPLDVPDLVDDRGTLRVRVGYAFGLGRNAPIEDRPIAFVAAGRILATVTTRNGEAEVPTPARGDSLGVFRPPQTQGAEPLGAVERTVSIVRPGSRRLVLFDAELAANDLATLATAHTVDLLGVRLRCTRSCHLLRKRLADAGVEPLVIDASAVLDEGDASDVGEDLDALRLSRVAMRLKAASFSVAAVVPRSTAVEPAPLREWVPPSAIAGNRVEVELDNSTARRWLFEAISGAQQRLHLQTYMAADDEIGRQLEAALRDAARHGVEVRVLIDSLHGQHGSLGMRNPLIERLLAAPGVEVRLWRPVTGVPSLVDLKQRDHRKLVVADGRIALLGGRNIAHEYYMGFDEVQVTPATRWRQIPWLDAGARVEGPAAAELDRTFRGAWVQAGGAPFEVGDAPPAGDIAVRVVVHHGLRDVRTLETWLALIDGARSHVDVVTGFPLMLEIQHALLRALRRGVRVRTLFGHVAPVHGSEPFEREAVLGRVAATWLVHSRQDALIAAGAEGYQFGVAIWGAELGTVRPHVHAKSMSADGLRCAVGSANLDVTGCYWESELLLDIEDPVVAKQFEARVDALVSGSVRVNRDDPEWQKLARRREWLHNWPGVLSV